MSGRSFSFFNNKRERNITLFKTERANKNLKKFIFPSGLCPDKKAGHKGYQSF